MPSTTAPSTTTPRTYVVTGSASGIGKALTERLRRDGNTVFGVDIRDADITVDLTTEQGRADLVAQAMQKSGGVLDGVVAVAGLAAPIPATVGVNYFGALATLEGLRPLLLKSDAPRAALVASLAAIEPVDDELLAALVANDEPTAIARATAIAGQKLNGASNTIYNSSKRAIALWLRANAPTETWAGASIPLNAIAPGVIATPMIGDALSSAEGRAALDAGAPSPLNGPAAPPEAPANLLAWLVSAENTNTTGQIIFVDGGADSIRRPGLI
ncbi:MAG: dehydrogenase, short-chain alcohol dehydrogenase like [Glaciihabitans sp.]|nr:dehydrogenase, short-chain alcohol dehydrogenase like [Glaciihabitans sp.]